MSRRRILSFVSTIAVVSIGILSYAIVFAPDTSGASSTVPAAAVAAPASPEARHAVETVAGADGSPLVSDAIKRIEHVFTPADPELPSFYSVPEKSGGACLVTSSGVLTSCSLGSFPGTVTIMDDSEADDIPAFVFGQVTEKVVDVTVNFEGRSEDASVGNGFYLFRLSSAAMSDESVTSVVLHLADGTEETILTAG